MKGGADDYLVKPIDLDELGWRSATRSGQTADKPEVSDRLRGQLPAGLIWESIAMRRLIETLAVVAPSDAPVLVTGESGVGKEMVAQLIHQWSPRSDGSAGRGELAGLPESLIESELFGHTKGPLPAPPSRGRVSSVRRRRDPLSRRNRRAADSPAARTCCGAGVRTNHAGR